MEEPTPPPEAPPRHEPTAPSWGDRLRNRPLRRDPDGPIAGVAGGVARWLELDPVIIRVALVVLVFLGGSGLIFYLAAWLLIPKANDPVQQPLAVSSSTTATVLGVIALVIGISVAVGNTIDWSGADWAFPAILIAGGVVLLTRNAATPSSTPPPPAPAEPIPPQAAGTNQPPPPVSDSTPLPPAPSDSTHWATTRLDEPAVEPEPPGPPITAITISAAAAVTGLLLVLDTAGVADISVVVLAGAALAVIGGGLVASAFLGRAPWLVPLGLLAVIGLSLAPIADASLDGGVGDRNVTVNGLTELQEHYELGVGEMIIDLRDVEMGSATREVEIDLGVGYTEIIVPRDVSLELTGDVDAGYLNFLGEEDSGLGAGSFVTHEGTGSGTLVLDIEVGIGAAEVRRG